MRQTLAFFLSVIAVCLAVSAIFIPAIHGQTAPMERANMAASYTSSGPLVIIPVTGTSALPSFAPPECTPDNHRVTMLCGKDMVQLLLTEGNVAFNLLLLAPFIASLTVVIATLRMSENSARKNTLIFSAGIVGVVAIAGWRLLMPVTDELPDLGYWLVVIAAGLTFIASLLGYTSNPKSTWVEQRLGK